MEVITITLDGVEVSGYAGMTILDLARESGVDIPTLCHDPHLPPYGACRLCLVEDEATKTLPAACVTPIRSGMVINTKSPRVMERRRTILQLMLASHPDSCLICDKGNRCQLREIAAKMGIGLSELQRIPQSARIEEVNPFIERDLSKCILCAKCIRADQELVVEGALDYLNRGFMVKPATLNDMPLEKSECTFCGTCVAICPTGALMEKEKTYRGTTAKIVGTVCPYCGCGCSINLEVKDNQLVRARPGPDNTVNRGTLCIRGSYGYDFIHSPERLLSPLVKVNGDFQKVSWEQALERVASEFKRIKESSGADSLAVLGSSKCTNEENYLLQRFARAVLGTNNIDNGSRLYSVLTQARVVQNSDLPLTNSTLNDMENSDVIMVVGANPDASAPAVAYAIRRAAKFKNARLILIEPRQTKLASFAHLWLKPKPGTDTALINGMAKAIIDEKLYDEEFTDKRTDNFPEFKNAVKSYTLKHVEEITGIPRQDIQTAARLFARAERASIVYGNGITQQVNGTDGVEALANLAMLTGNKSQQEVNTFALQRENNARGACDMGSLPDFLPGYQSLDDAKARQQFEQCWGTALPVNAGVTALEMIEQAGKGAIKGMLIMGENPVASFPNPSLVKKALTSLEFLVVSDLFLTETAKMANVVLPAASFAEKEGRFTNFEGRVQQVHQAIEPAGESLPDREIILRLAKSAGQPMPYSSPKDIGDEIEKLVPLYAPSRSEKAGNPTKNSYQEAPDKPGHFALVEYTPPTGIPTDDYPLTLITGSIPSHLGSGTRSRQAPRLRKFIPNSWLEISPTDARELSLGEGETVRIISLSGEVTTKIRITDTLPVGLLFMPISFSDSPVNQLFDVVLDPEAKTPALKSCAVRLERI